MTKLCVNCQYNSVILNLQLLAEQPKNVYKIIKQLKLSKQRIQNKTVNLTWQWFVLHDNRPLLPFRKNVVTVWVCVAIMQKKKEERCSEFNLIADNHHHHLCHRWWSCWTLHNAIDYRAIMLWREFQFNIDYNRQVKKFGKESETWIKCEVSTWQLQ